MRRPLRAIIRASNVRGDSDHSNSFHSAVVDNSLDWRIIIRLSRPPNLKTYQIGGQRRCERWNVFQIMDRKANEHTRCDASTFPRAALNINAATLFETARLKGIVWCIAMFQLLDVTSIRALESSTHPLIYECGGRLGQFQERAISTNMGVFLDWYKEKAQLQSVISCCGQSGSHTNVT